MSKPWLYKYATEPRDCFGNRQPGPIEVMGAVRCTLCGCAGVHGCPGPSKGWTETLVDEVRRERAQKAALVRALLPQEFVPRDGNDENCQACNAYGPELRGTFSETDYHAEYGPSGHKEGCPLDAALTAAGLPDQASRDEARAAIARRAVAEENADVLKELADR